MSNLQMSTLANLHKFQTNFVYETLPVENVLQAKFAYPGTGAAGVHVGHMRAGCVGIGHLGICLLVLAVLVHAYMDGPTGPPTVCC